MNLNKNTNVVFADDSDIHHFLLKNLIPQFASLELVCHASDGDELLRMIDRHRDIPDVAILDLHMPRLNGNLTAKELLARFPKIKIYGFTSSSDEKERSAMLRYGFCKVYSKNQLRDLLTEIASLSL